MAREVFFTKTTGDLGKIEASIQFDEGKFGEAGQGVTPWTVSINDGAQDLGRIVGFEGEGQTIIAMHGLKPDLTARRGAEITVFRVNDDLRARGLDGEVLRALERWLLKRGWRGNVLKKMKFTAAEQVMPVRTFWVQQGYELVLMQEGKWDEHVVKRWR
jgi:GNAT superfamily N-acetyltransferase